MSLFELRFERDEGTRYHVAARTDFEVSKQELIDLQVPPQIEQKFRNLCETGPGLRVQDREKHQELCREAGGFLFSTVFVGDVKRLYDEYLRDNYGRSPPEGVPRLALRLPTELYQLPWELLFDKDDARTGFLALAGTVTRLDDDRKHARIHVAVSRIELVYFSASPRSKPFAEIKFHRHHRINLQHKSATTYKSFTEYFLKHRSPHGVILHGHGEIQNSAGKNHGHFGFVTDDLNNDWRVADAVTPYFGDPPTLRTGVILACESAWIFSGLAFECTFAGKVFQQTPLDFVIGMQGKIDATAAWEFLRTVVYMIVEHRSPLDLAVKEGRRQVYALSELDPVVKNSYQDWWLPVVYARTMSQQILAKEDEATEHQSLWEDDQAVVVDRGHITKAEIVAKLWSEVLRRVDRLFEP